MRRRNERRRMFRGKTSPKACLNLAVVLICLYVFDIFGNLMSSNGIQDLDHGTSDSSGVHGKGSKYALSFFTGRKKNKLLVIGAGHGSTGTHLIFHTTCHLGFSSVHWNMGCLSPNNNQFQENEIKGRFATHDMLRKEIHNMHTCIHRRSKSCGNALEWKANILTLVDELVQHRDGDIQAFHDTPYPYIISQLVEASYRFDRIPIIILSERDPETYAKRRSSSYYGWSDPICIDPLSINDTDRSFPGGGYDLIGCVEHAASKSKSPESLDLVDLFISYEALVDANLTTGLQTISNEFAAYQSTKMGRFQIQCFRDKSKDCSQNFGNCPRTTSAFPPNQKSIDNVCKLRKGRSSS